MGRQLHYSGLVVAGIGFFLTRFTVTLALYDDPVRFYVAGVVPLMLGLGLAAFGVALVVADVEAALVRTTAIWCVVGAGTMLVLVVLTLVGSSGGVPDTATMRSQTYLSNFLIGGSVGGTLTGLYAARNRRHRGEIQRQANRLRVLNRLLRHEILNAVTVIRGYTSLRGQDEGAADVIEEHSRAIQRTVEEVKFLARSGPATDAVDLATCLEASVDTLTDRQPGATVTIRDPPEGVRVRSTGNLSHVFSHLLENAVIHGEDDAPVVETSVEGDVVRVRISDRGAGLPAAQRALLESGEIRSFDDPDTGFGLNVARLIVEDVGGSIQTEVDGSGTSITVVLPRADDTGTGLAPLRSGEGVRPALPHLVVTLAAALLAGVCYGATSEALGGSVAGIGVFYGASNAVVGWITHEFHSVVFGFVFAGLVALAPERHQQSVPAYVVIGLGWALFLWLVAAGIIAPVWLRLLGIPASIPNVSAALLASHLVWGASLGVFTAVGYRHVVPWLADLERPVDRRTERAG